MVVHQNDAATQRGRHEPRSCDVTTALGPPRSMNAIGAAITKNITCAIASHWDGVKAQH